MVYILKMKTITLGRIYQMKLKKKKKRRMVHLFFSSLLPLVKCMYKLLPKVMSDDL